MIQRISAKYFLCLENDIRSKGFYKSQSTKNEQTISIFVKKRNSACLTCKNLLAIDCDK